ncbi:hypothetical protein [Actinoallomurus liliacearum]
MVRRRNERSIARPPRNGRILALAVLLCGVSGVLAPAQARASQAAIGRVERMGALPRGDGHGKWVRVAMHVGNGKFNKNYTTVLSPTVNRGLQQVSNTNVSGRTNTQVAFCRKRHRICRISQRMGARWGW